MSSSGGSRGERRPEPPGGDPPPTSAWLEDANLEVDLSSLAHEICRRYRHEFPDEQERHGDAGHAWCVHDNLYLLCWAVEAVNGYVDMSAEVS